ncbi:MAG TPA: hypothetical protein VNJ07_08860 [Chitinophagales bacterium]|nr:hypothetical protein [Chitinophagales bacterium]
MRLYFIVMQEHHLHTQRTARYFTLGEISVSTKAVWLACHGYGQLAREFISELQPLAEPGVAVAAPEGLSRFYTKGFVGTVGASWMTREDRESEIDDYVSYLQKLFETIKGQVSTEASIHALGFSQGCSTLCRWVARKVPAIDSLWLCCGSIPDDLDFARFCTALRSVPARLLVGEDDPFIADNDREAVRQRIKKHRLPVQVHTFKGGHVLNVTLLKSLMTQPVNS